MPVTEAEWAKLGLSKSGQPAGAEAAGNNQPPNDLYAEEHRPSEIKPWWKTNFFVQEPVLFGTWDGVFTSVLINIFGVIVFIRTGWMVGNAGIEQSILILVLGTVLALIPVLSAIGICERCQCQSGGVYFLVSHILGGQIGAAVGIMYSIGQAVACALVAIGFGESMASLLKTDNIWAIRAIAFAITLLLVGINLAGVKWVVKFQLLLLVLLILGVADFVIGSFISRHPDEGVTGFSQENWRNNTTPHYQHGDNFFTVFGVFFSTFTGVLSGVNMAGDLRNPSKNIPLGELTALLCSTFMCLLFVLILGAACQRHYLLTDFMIAEKVSWLGVLFLTALYISSLSSVLGSLYGAPRVLQSIASENVIPLMKKLETGKGPNRVPIYAILVVFILSGLFIMIGKLNLLAQIATMPYLLTYAFINYAYVSLSMTYDLQQTRLALLEQGIQGKLSQNYGSMEFKRALAESGSDLDQLFAGSDEGNAKRGGAAAEVIDGVENTDSILSRSGGESKSPIVRLSTSWYSVFCNRWVALIGTVVNLIIIFMVHWGFALAHIALLLLIYFYIGHVNPGVFSGISEFSIKQSCKLLISKRQGEERDAVIFPPAPGVQTSTARLTDDNVDYATRDQYHQSKKEMMQDFD